MTRPWKYPKTGIFWLRKRVPKDLLSVVGRLEEKRSLATRDPLQAKRRLAEALLEVEARWAHLRSAPGAAALLKISASTSLSELEAHEIARVFYDRYLKVYSGNPSEGFWKPEIGQTLWRKVDMSASLRLQRLPQGEYETLLPPTTEFETSSDSLPGSKAGVSFARLFDGWRAEKLPSQKTSYAWKRAMEQLSVHLGHTDGGRLTPEDVIG